MTSYIDPKLSVHERAMWTLYFVEGALISSVSVFGKGFGDGQVERVSNLGQGLAPAAYQRDCTGTRVAQRYRVTVQNDTSDIFR